MSETKSIFGLRNILVAISLSLFGTGVYAADEATSPSMEQREIRSEKKAHGMLRPQNNWVNYELLTGFDIPPNKEVEANEMPTTQNDFLRIRQESKEVLSKNPKDAGAYLDLAYASRNLNDNAAAIDCCNKSIELDPRLAIAYVERALANEQLKQFNLAQEDLLKAIALNSKNPSFYSHLARIYLQTRQWQKAVDECTKSISMSAKHSPAFYYRAKAYVCLDEFEKALSDYDEAIKLDPEKEAVYYVDRAYVFVQLDKFADAISDLQKAVKIDPEDFPRQIDTVFRGGRSDFTADARQRVYDLAKVLDASEPHSKVLRLALFHRFLRNYVLSIEAFDQAIKEFPKVSELYKYRGETYYDKQDYEKAIADFTVALDLEPADADALKYRAESFLRRKQFEQAVADLTQLIKIRPDRVAYMLRSSAYRALGQQDRALADLRDFTSVAQHSYMAKNNPDHANYQKFLQRDLDKYFSDSFGKTTIVEFEAIQAKLHPGAALGLPRSFYWLRVMSDGRLMAQGAASVLAIHKERFVVQKFLDIQDIKKNPRYVIQYFPRPIADEIFQHSAMKPVAPSTESSN